MGKESGMMESKMDSVSHVHGFVLVLGIFSLTVGVSLLAIGVVFTKPQMILAKEVQITLMGTYAFELHAEKYDWLEFDVNSSKQSFVYIRLSGGAYPQIVFNGTRLSDSFQINETGQYSVVFRSAESTFPPVENVTYSGYFHLRGQRVDIPLFVNSGVALIVAAPILMVSPVISPFLFRPSIRRAMRQLNTSGKRHLGSSLKPVTFFMLVIGIFYAAFGLCSLLFVPTDPYLGDFGPSPEPALFGFLLLATGAAIETVRKRYLQN